MVFFRVKHFNCNQAIIGLANDLLVLKPKSLWTALLSLWESTVQKRFNVRPAFFYTKVFVYNSVAICRTKIKRSHCTLYGPSIYCVRLLHIMLFSLSSSIWVNILSWRANLRSSTNPHFRRNLQSLDTNFSISTQSILESKSFLQW